MPWIRTPLVLASSDAALSGLSMGQVAEAYAGRMKAWPDGRPLRLVLRSAFESETLQLKSMSTDIAHAVDLALQRRDLPVADNDLSALALIAKLSGSLGSSSLGLILSTQTRVRTLAINGREPSLAHMLSGTYPWSRPYLLVLAPQASAAAQALRASLQSEAAMRVLQTLGYAATA